MKAPVLPEFEISETRGNININFQNTEYKFGKPIAEGGYGRVFQAIHRSSGKKLAVKCIRVDNGDENEAPGSDVLPTEMHHILEELKFQKYLADKDKSHSHIIQVFAKQEYNGIMHILMEYAENGDALNSLPQISANPCLLKSLFQQVVQGVKHLHSCRVIHMDLKPENLLLIAPAKLKIADFGLAASFPSLDQKVAAWYGTSQYGAPETFDEGNENLMQPSLDLWATGIILLNFATGRKEIWERAEQSDEKYMEWSTKGQFYKSLRKNKNINSEVFDLACDILVEDVQNRPTIFEIEKHQFFKEHNLRKRPRQLEIVDGIKKTKQVPSLNLFCS